MDDAPAEDANAQRKESARSATKRAVIVEAALRVFLRRGFSGASVDEIAAEAHVSKPTIYAHFISKDELFRRIIADIVAHAQVDLTAFVSKPAQSATDTGRELREY